LSSCRIGGSSRRAQLPATYSHTTHIRFVINTSQSFGIITSIPTIIIFIVILLSQIVVNDTEKCGMCSFLRQWLQEMSNVPSKGQWVTVFLAPVGFLAPLTGRKSAAIGSLSSPPPLACVMYWSRRLLGPDEGWTTFLRNIGHNGLDF
jgi:hypothetical protein